MTARARRLHQRHRHVSGRRQALEQLRAKRTTQAFVKELGVDTEIPVTELGRVLNYTSSDYGSSHSNDVTQHPGRADL